MDEGRKLQRITRTSKDPVRLRRAIVVLVSGQGRAVRDITLLMQVGEDCVRDVIRAFNERGFATPAPKWSGGRSRTIGEAIRERIRLIARTSPADWGLTRSPPGRSRSCATTLCLPGNHSYRSQESVETVHGSGHVPAL